MRGEGSPLIFVVSANAGLEKQKEEKKRGRTLYRHSPVAVVVSWATLHAR
jgi:hypothetical protein